MRESPVGLLNFLLPRLDVGPARVRLERVDRAWKPRKKKNFVWWSVVFEVAKRTEQNETDDILILSEGIFTDSVLLSSLLYILHFFQLIAYLFFLFMHLFTLLFLHLHFYCFRYILTSQLGVPEFSYRI